MGKENGYFEAPIDETTYEIRTSEEEYLYCNKYNTTLFTWIGTYAIFNHIFHYPPEEDPIYMFDCDATIAEMVNLGFDTYISTIEPTRSDQTAYFIYQHKRLERELKEL